MEANAEHGVSAGLVVATWAGAAWALAAGFALGGAGLLAGVVVAAVGAIALTAAKRRTDLPPARGWRPGPGYRRLVGLEAAAIAACAIVLSAVGAHAAVVPAIGLVVGVHFLALARVLAAKRYEATGAALCLVAVTGLVAAAASAGTTATTVIVGVGAAAALWGTAAWTLSALRAGRGPRPAPGLPVTP